MTIPQSHPERREWLFDRAGKLERLLDEDWIEDEIRKLWNNPEEYANEGLYDPSGIENEELYALVHFAVGFGIEYERQYPQSDERYSGNGGSST